MYIYHLHNYKQIGQEKYYNGVCIRFLLEDDIYAENNGLDFFDLKYGTASRYELRDKIYPDFMTYRKWIELSNNYSKVILSLNFDTYSQKYKEFCKKILKQFPRNKNIIVSAVNECYEKRGSAEKVYQATLEVHQAIQETGRNYPLAFWNQKIKTSGEKQALETLLDDSRIKDICKYFAFQSLETTSANVNKYVWIAKLKGFFIVEIELGNLVDDYDTLLKRFKLLKSLETDDVVIMCPTIHKKLSDLSSIWGKYTLSTIYNGEFNITIKSKHQIIQYAQQFKTKGGEDMRLEKYYYKGRSEGLIKYDKQGYGIRFLRACFGLNDSNEFDVVLTTEVEEYQSANGLLIDGKVGPETFGNMIKVADYQKYYCWVHSLWARDM